MPTLKNPKQHGEVHLAEAGYDCTPQQREERRHDENDVENELRVELADALHAVVKQNTIPVRYKEAGRLKRSPT